MFQFCLPIDKHLSQPMWWPTRKKNCLDLLYRVAHLCSLILFTVSVAYKLSKKKADSNLQMLHTILFGKKSNVNSPSYAFYFTSFQFTLKSHDVLLFFLLCKVLPLMLFAWLRVTGVFETSNFLTEVNNCIDFAEVQYET